LTFDIERVKYFKKFRVPSMSSCSSSTAVRTRTTWEPTPSSVSPWQLARPVQLTRVSLTHKCLAFNFHFTCSGLFFELFSYIHLLNECVSYVSGVPLYRHIADLAGVKEVMMPVPAFNIINGGSHAGNKLAMQARFTTILLKKCSLKCR